MGLEVVVPGVLAFDPGKSTGWARFELSTLVACGTLDPEREALPFYASNQDRIVIERPRVQGNRVPANDIITLGIRAGVIAGRMHGLRAVEWVEVGTWKGQLPKAICHSRIAAELSAQEREIVKGEKHDAWDAVGIGLWAIGRFRC